MSPEKWLDLGLNLFSEVVGILLTVFLVDRVLKRREETRWKPTKNYLYTRLTELIWEIFVNFSPPSLYEDEKEVVITFGDLMTHEVRDITPLGLGSRYTSITDSLKRELDNQVVDLWINEHNSFAVESKRTIDVIINDSNAFLEPEVLHRIILLREKLGRIVCTSSEHLGQREQFAKVRFPS